MDLGAGSGVLRQPSDTSGTSGTGAPSTSACRRTPIRSEPRPSASNVPGASKVPGRHRHRLLRIWMASTAVLLVVGALWSLATPLGAAPDEPTQVVKAAAVVRGELTGQATEHRTTAVVEVRVPESFADDAGLATCYAGRDTIPAGCAPHLSGKRRAVETATYVGRYPPLYYLLVGTPTLVWTTDVAIYAMRLLSVAWSALLLGLAFAVAAVFSRRRLLIGALAVAVSPLVIFLSSVVNPSGLEITAAVATWTTGLVLFVEHRKRPPPALAAACTVSACVLVLCRGLSALWLALVAITLIALVPQAVKELWRVRLVRWSAAGITVVSVAAVAFVVHAKSLSVVPDGKALPPHTTGFAVLVAALGRTGVYLHQAVGVFGWLDTPSPVAVLLGWWVAVGVVVVVGLVVSRRRQAAVLVGLLATALLLPAAIIASQAHHDGLVWQARDGMPLYVGIPLVAAVIAGGGDARGGDGREPWSSLQAASRLTVLVITGVAAAQFVDFGWALRRYTVGLGTTLDPLARVSGGWVPPVPALALLLAGLGAFGIYGWWLQHLARPERLVVTRALPAQRTPGMPAEASPTSQWELPTSPTKPGVIEHNGPRPMELPAPTSAPVVASVDVGAIVASVMAEHPPPERRTRPRVRARGRVA